MPYFRSGFDALFDDRRLVGEPQIVVRAEHQHFAHLAGLPIPYRHARAGLPDDLAHDEVVVHHVREDGGEERGLAFDGVPAEPHADEVLQREVLGVLLDGSVRHCPGPAGAGVVASWHTPGFRAVIIMCFRDTGLQATPRPPGTLLARPSRQLSGESAASCSSSRPSHRQTSSGSAWATCRCSW